jgi:hypothetical protein
LLKLPGQVYSTAGVPAPGIGQLGFACPYPNPARGTTTLRFSLATRAAVTLSVYDVQGRRIVELVNGMTDAGIHTLAWKCSDEDGRSVSPGVYLARFQTGNVSLVQKVNIIR